MGPATLRAGEVRETAQHASGLAQSMLQGGRLGAAVTDAGKEKPEWCAYLYISCGQVQHAETIVMYYEAELEHVHVPISDKLFRSQVQHTLALLCTSEDVSVNASQAVAGQAVLNAGFSP